jgi:hypothetical protein
MNAPFRPVRSGDLATRLSLCLITRVGVPNGSVLLRDLARGLRDVLRGVVWVASVKVV